MKHTEAHPACGSMYGLYLRLLYQSAELRQESKEMECLAVFIGNLEIMISQNVTSNPDNILNKLEERFFPNLNIMIKENISYTPRAEESLAVGNLPRRQSESNFSYVMPQDSDDSIDFQHTFTPNIKKYTGSTRAQRRMQVMEEYSTGPTSKGKNFIVPTLNLPSKPGEQRENVISLQPTQQEQEFETSLVEENTTIVIISGVERMKNLANSLGEGCLTRDLTALMAQKRDIMLIQMAKNNALPNVPLNFLQGNIQKQRNRQKIRRANSLTLINSFNQTVQIPKKRKTQKTSPQAILLSIIDFLISQHSLEELGFIRNPVNLIYILMSYRAGNEKEAVDYSSDEEENHMRVYQDIYKNKNISSANGSTNENEDVAPNEGPTVVGMNDRGPGALPMGSNRQKLQNDRHDDLNTTFTAVTHSSYGESQLEISDLDGLRLQRQKLSDLIFSEEDACLRILHRFSLHVETLHQKIGPSTIESSAFRQAFTLQHPTLTASTNTITRLVNKKAINQQQSVPNSSANIYQEESSFPTPNEELF